MGCSEGPVQRFSVVADILARNYPLRLQLHSANMSIYELEPLSLEKVRTYPLAKRKSKVSVQDFGQPHRRGAAFAQFLDSLPRILAGEDLRAVVAAILRARAHRKAVLWGLGGHVIKVGLPPAPT